MERACVFLVVLSFSLCVWECTGDVHRYDVAEGVNSALPANCSQVRRYRGVGTQNYICTAAKDPASNKILFVWQLQQPFAYLFEYYDDGSNTRLMTTPAGYHSFLQPYIPNVQSACFPTFTFGLGCDISSCVSVQSSWVGRCDNVKGDAQSNTIRWLLISRNATATSGTGVIPTCSYAQRLATLDGLPPASGCAETVDVFNTWGSLYQADYIFSVCGADASSTLPGSERQGGQTIVNIITNS